MKDRDYVQLYRIAYQILGSELLKQIDDDEEILKWKSREGWLMLPLPNEESLDEARNRLDPNIYIHLSEEEGKNFVDMGITANTLDSVEKLKNILDNFHNNEKEELLSYLKDLDDSFITIVNSKIKEHHFAETPSYREEFAERSNQIDDDRIKRMFSTVKTIREIGLKRKELMGTSHPVETPNVDLVYCKFPKDTTIFEEKLQQIKPIFETCLSVKRNTEIRKAKKAIRDSEIVSICKKCNEIIPEENHEGPFCSKCGTLIKRTKMKNVDDSYREREN